MLALERCAEDHDILPEKKKKFTRFGQDKLFFISFMLLVHLDTKASDWSEFT